MKISDSKKKLTILVDTDVYQGLKKVAGSRNIGAYVSDLARPYVVACNLDAEYKAMAADEEREKEAVAWLEGTREAPIGENVWQFNQS